VGGGGESQAKNTVNIISKQLHSAIELTNTPRPKN